MGALALGALVVPPAIADSHDVVATTVDVVGITDFHGRLEASNQSAGAASLAAAVNHFRAQNPDNTVFVTAGDNIGATTFTSFIQCDHPTIEALNAMGLDVSALGNHEFDRGRDDFDVRFMDEPGVLDDERCPTTPLPAQFPYLAANLYEADGSHAYDPFWIWEGPEHDIAFIGAVTEGLPSLVSPAGIASLTVGDIVPAVEDAVADIGDQAAAIVLLLHEGATPEIIGNLPAAVDAVFTGHTHETFADTVSVGSWNGVIVQAGQYGEYLGQVSLGFNAAGELIAVTPELHDLVTTSVGPDGRTQYHLEYPPGDEEAEVARIVADAVEYAAERGDEPLGLIAGDFLRARQTDDLNATDNENRGGESTLGNLVADVHLWAAREGNPEVQIAFMNPGGLRDDMRAGDDGVISYREAATVQPFANTLVTLDLTGAQVVQVLEEQWQPEGESRPFLKLGVSGLLYTYDPEAPAGQRITDVWLTEDGEVLGLLDPTAIYTVVANSFLASGGDNFDTLAEGTGHADTGRVDLEAMVAYMAEFAPVGGDEGLVPDLAQRSVGVTVAQPADGYPAGADVTVDLSSLLFSAVAPGIQGETVLLMVDGDIVASADIDTTIVEGLDEQGRATVTFAAPAGTEGDLVQVDVVVPDNGTWAAFPIVLGAQAAPPVVTPPAPPAQPAPPATGRNPGLRVETGR